MYRPNTLMRAAVVAAAGSLVLAGCGGSDGDSGNTTKKASGVQLYFVDGNTADYSGDFDKGTLNGVRSTFPGAELGDEFKQRLLKTNPKLKDFTYGPESYDATVVVSLAAIAAKNDSGKAIAGKMAEVTEGGEKCTTFKDCAAALKAGKDIDYDGVSGPIDLNSTGSPSAATIGIFQYGDDNNYTNQDYVTGKTDINAAGGVLGKPVKQVKADSGDGSPNIAPSETDKLLRGKADAVIGAASSSVSLSVIDKITGSGVVEVSPANTSTAFDTYADKGLYFRTAPSDVLQGQVMAQTVSGDGYQNIAILARQDSYGEALANNVKKFYTESGGKVVSFKLYDANAANYTAEVNAIKAADPDAIVLIAFDETKKIIPELIKAGLGQKK